MLSKPVIIIGIGEMGSVFARGLLRIGIPVVPVTRDSTISQVSKAYPEPLMVLVAVGEKDLDFSLKSLPENWKKDLALLQNELLPNNWRKHNIGNPSVISVWFEKKKGQDFKVLISSPAYGPHAQVLVDALQSIGINSHVVESEQELLNELVVKNVYIITTNVCGLITGGTVSQLWEKHQQLARDVADEVMTIQESLINEKLNRKAILEKMLLAFDGDPKHQCMGRSAPQRLQRALTQAANANLETPHLQKIAEKANL